MPQTAPPPVEPDAGDVRPAVEVVLVRVGGTRCAVPMRAVGEVGRPPGLTRVPGLPSWVAGVANWRGRVLAVLDLRPLLSPGTAAAAARRARLVVLSGDGAPVGLLVDAVEGTVEVCGDAVEPALAHLPEEAAALLEGQVTDADGPFGLLDLAAVAALADRLPRPRRTG